ncbi:aminoglycoside phosphotransferase family protein [Deinococcus aquatilis]|uniref:aminoglycoside phosphotransferase family protein n=1 Tax=Deinococcus aquatilis TaxID=519440 RepID=UPI00037D4001|nr:aminoglycoside phosphotransferase family protein [Deinococcus aquatilis]
MTTPSFGSHDWLENVLAVTNSLNPTARAARQGRPQDQRPTSLAPALVRGDRFLDNVITAGERVTGLIDCAFADVGDPCYDVAMATHELTRFRRDAFTEGYGSAVRLRVQEAAYFAQVALLF